MTDDTPLVLPDAAAWRAWLDANEDISDGVWLLIAKKGTVEPTSLRIEQALEEALCSGWIDGQRKGFDGAAFHQRYTPRRTRSLWSRRNVELVARLIDEGRMRPRGHAEIERAKADGRWDRAYAGDATIEVPDYLTAALAEQPAAAAMFAALNGANRYAVLHRLVTAPSDRARSNRLARIVDMLGRGETFHPQ